MVSISHYIAYIIFKKIQKLNYKTFKRRKIQESENSDSSNIKSGKFSTNKFDNKKSWDDNNAKEQPKMYQKFIILEKEGEID